MARGFFLRDGRDATRPLVAAKSTGMAGNGRYLDGGGWCIRVKLGVGATGLDGVRGWVHLARTDVLSTKPGSAELDGEHGRDGEAPGGDRSLATTAAIYGALGGQRGAAGGGEAHRAALT